MAMSQVTKLSGLHLTDFSEDNLYCDTNVQKAQVQMLTLVPREISLVKKQIAKQVQ